MIISCGKIFENYLLYFLVNIVIENLSLNNIKLKVLFFYQNFLYYYYSRLLRAYVRPSIVSEQDVSDGRFRVLRTRAVLTHFCASWSRRAGSVFIRNDGQQIIARNNCSDYNNGLLRTTARDDSFRTATWRAYAFWAVSFGNTHYFERCYQMGNNAAEVYSYFSWYYQITNNESRFGRVC